MASKWCQKDSMRRREDWTRVTLRLPPDVHGRIAEAAALENVSLNALILRTLEDTFPTNSVKRRRRSDSLIAALRDEYQGMFTADDRYRIEAEVGKAFIEKILTQKDW